MDAKYLKEYIFENNHIKTILSELGMHHIIKHNSGKYFTCGQPNGDNPISTIVYNNENLNVKAYTRNITDSFGNSDIISLVCYIRKCYFSHALKWLCDIVGLDYYTNPDEELPESIRWTRQLLKMMQYIDEEEIEVLKPINEWILSYYHQQPILQWWQHEGISLNTQAEFEIGFDLQTERIAIPIRDELSNLVGVKGRLFLRDPSNLLSKYMYIEPCAKTHILYGLHKTFKHIKKKGYVIVCESEKGVLQLWSQGYKNAVSIGGHSFSKIQIEKITRLDTTVIIAFDKDITESDILIECAKFMNNINMYYIMDKDGLLEGKQSPMDDTMKFERLLKNNKYTYTRS